MNRQMKWFASAAVAAFAGAALAQSASAGTIAYEGFDYANNTALPGAAGGSGWTGAWSGSGSTAKVETDQGGNYTYPGLTSEGTVHAILGNGTVDRTLDLSSVSNLTTGGKLGKAGTTIWFSFIARIGGYWPSSSAKIGLALTDDGAQKLSIGMEGANWALATALSDNTDDTPIIAGDGPDVNLFVGEIQFRDSGSTVNIWANPDLSGAAPTGGTQITDAIFQAFNFNGIELQMNLTGATIRADEIRIGTDFASVISNVPVPEPASLALLGLGGLAMLRRRRAKA